MRVRGAEPLLAWLSTTPSTVTITYRYHTRLMACKRAKTALDLQSPSWQPHGMECSATVVSGLHIAYRHAGTGEAILLLHGNPASSWTWRKIIPFLSEIGRTIAPDLYGFGDSDKPAPETGLYRPLAYASFVSEFCDMLGLERVHLVLHDWGGPIGIHFALAEPDRVASLAVLNTVFYSDYEMHPIAAEMRKPGVGEELMASLTREAVVMLVQGLRRTQLSDEELEPYVRMILDPAYQAACLALYRSVGPDSGIQFDASELLASLRNIPSIVIWSPDDPGIPAHFGPRLAKDLGCEYHEVSGAMHFLQEDQPAEVGALLRAHIAGHLLVS